MKKYLFRKTKTIAFLIIFLNVFVISSSLNPNFMRNAAAVTDAELNTETYGLYKSMSNRIVYEKVKSRTTGVTYTDGRSDYYQAEINAPSFKSFQNRGIYSQTENSTTYYASVIATYEYNYYSLYSINQLNIVRRDAQSKMLGLVTYESAGESNPGVTDFMHRWKYITYNLNNIYYGAGFRLRLDYIPFEATVSALSDLPVKFYARFDRVNFGLSTLQPIGSYKDETIDTQDTEATFSSETIPTSGVGYDTSCGGKATLNQVIDSNLENLQFQSWSAHTSSSYFTEFDDLQSVASIPSLNSQIDLQNSQDNAQFDVPITMCPQIRYIKNSMVLTSCEQINLDIRTGITQGLTCAGVDGYEPFVQSTVDRTVGVHIYNKNVKGTINVEMTLFSEVPLDIQEFQAGQLGDPNLEMSDVIWDSSFSSDSGSINVLPESEVLPDSVLSTLDKILDLLSNPVFWIIVIIVVLAIVGIVIYLKIRSVRKLAKAVM